MIGRSAGQARWQRAVKWAMPWLFVAIIIAVGPPLRDWAHQRFPGWFDASQDQAGRDADTIMRHARGSATPVTARVLRVIDGDTFVARVQIGASTALTTRVRLRDIDAPEMAARCDVEFRGAEAARDALRGLTRDGAVTLTQVGVDKYSRILAKVATRQTPDLSAELVKRGVARPYLGGRRGGWCDGG